MSGNNGIARLMSRRGSFLPEHHLFRNASWKGKYTAVKTAHLHLRGRRSLQPFGHGFPGKRPFHCHDRQKYDSADGNTSSIQRAFEQVLSCAFSGDATSVAMAIYLDAEC